MTMEKVSLPMAYTMKWSRVMIVIEVVAQRIMCSTKPMVELIQTKRVQMDGLLTGIMTVKMVITARTRIEVLVESFI